MSRTIAIVEDDPEQRTHYAQALRLHAYHVEEYGDRASAIQAFEQSLPDLAILDIMLGSEVGGGFDVCRYLQSRSMSVPVIFLTSRGDELDKIYGLQLGAWDYQTKPVSLDYLIARIQSLFQIRDHNHRSTEGIRNFGALQINAVTMAASWDGNAIELTPTEFDILTALVDQPDGCSYDALAQATKQGVVENNTINTHIVHIRKKFKTIEPAFDCIKTKYGYGYLWACR